MKYLIWSHEHTAWWRPHRWGYTTSVDEAGRYSQQQASTIVADANIVALNEQMVPEHQAWLLRGFDVDVVRVVLKMELMRQIVPTTAAKVEAVIDRVCEAFQRGDIEGGRHLLHTELDALLQSPDDDDD